MAVTKADKTAELEQLESAFKGSETAILVDYKGLNVPQVTDLRRQLRAAKASYKVVKNTLAKRALKGTSFEVLEAFFEGTTAVAYTATDPVALAKTLTMFVKATPAMTTSSSSQTVKSDSPRRPGGCSCAKKTSRSGPCTARHRRTRRARPTHEILAASARSPAWRVERSRRRHRAPPA